jgi:hypothetical protein
MGVGCAAGSYGMAGAIYHHICIRAYYPQDSSLADVSPNNHPVFLILPIRKLPTSPKSADRNNLPLMSRKAVLAAL